MDTWAFELETLGQLDYFMSMKLLTFFRLAEI